jgi:hypothetical protein
MDEIANPHDAYFRESFGRSEIARDFRRVHLPDAVLAEVDLDSLKTARIPTSRPICARSSPIWSIGCAGVSNL